MSDNYNRPRSGSALGRSADHVQFSSNVLGGSGKKYDRSPSGGKHANTMNPSGILKSKRSASNLEGSGKGMRAIKENVTDADSYLSRSGDYDRLGMSRSKDVLEDSVREPNRAPEYIHNLTLFLQDEYRDKYGIFCDNAQSLLNFWRDHVSAYYRQRNERIKSTKEAIGGYSVMSPSPQTPLFKSRPRASSALKFSAQDAKRLGYEPSSEINRKAEEKRLQYADFSQCYEMDVTYTIEQDIRRMKDQRTSKQLAAEKYYKAQLREEEKEQQKKCIETIVEHFYRAKLEDSLEATIIEERKKYKADQIKKKKELRRRKEREEYDDLKRKRSPSRDKSDGRKSPDKDKSKTKYDGPKKHIDFGDDSMGSAVSITDDDEGGTEKAASEDEGERSKKISEGKKERKSSKKRSRSRPKDNTRIDLPFPRPESPRKEIKPEPKPKGLFWVQPADWINLSEIARGVDRLDMLKAESEKLGSACVTSYKRFKAYYDELTKDVTAAIQHVAEVKLGHNANEILQTYQSAPNKPVPTERNYGDEKVKMTLTRVIEDFFSNDHKVLRLQLYKDRVKKRGGHVTLLAFYIFTRSEERIRNLFSFKTKKDAETAIKSYENAVKKKIEEAKKAAEKEEMKRKAKAQKKIYKNVFGKQFHSVTGELEFTREEGRKDYTAPNEGKHRTREALMKLKKEFKHENILHNMLDHELADDRVFKYPDEYDIFDDAKEKSMKTKFAPMYLQEKPTKAMDEAFWEKQKVQLQNFYQKDDRDYESDQNDRKRLLRKEKALERFMQAAAIKYTEWRKARENPNDASGVWRDEELKMTQRGYIAEVYQRLMNVKNEYSTDVKATEAAKQRFPHPHHLIFGFDAKETETIKKSYPDTFKRYFFRMVKAIVKIKGKNVLLKKPPSMIIEGKSKEGGQKPLKFGEFVDQSKNAYLKPLVFGEIVDELSKKEPKGFRSRIFQRQDKKKVLENIFMQFEEVKNCTFQTKMAPVPDFYEFSKDYVETDKVDEFDPKAYVDGMGKDFSRRHPEIYKFGKIRKARRDLAEGGYEKCISTLCDAFDLTQVYMKFKPDQWKIWNDVKKLQEEEKQEALKKKQNAAKNKADPQHVKTAESATISDEEMNEIKKVFMSFFPGASKSPSRSPAKQKLKFDQLELAMNKLGFKPMPAEIRECENSIRVQTDNVAMNNYAQRSGSGYQSRTAIKKSGIYLDDFIKIMEKKFASDLSDADLEKCFKMIDGDDSGAISRQEFEEVLKGIGCNFYPQEIAEMVEAADKDGNGEIDLKEFKDVMKSRKKKITSVDYKAAMQQLLKRFMAQKELEKKFKKIGAHIPRLLNKFWQLKEDRLNDAFDQGSQKKKERQAVYYEQLEKPAFRALYEECWDLLQEIFKITAEEEKRKDTNKKYDKQLKEMKRLLEEQLKNGYDESEEQRTGSMPSEATAKTQDYRKLFKCIMCPMKNNCPKYLGPRWPASNQKSTTKLGKDCPYAHHLMELVFPATLEMRLKGNTNNLKRQMLQPKISWNFTGELRECPGCSRCNQCKYKILAREVMDKMHEKVLNRRDKNKDDIRQRMKDNEQKTENFYKKFGYLKKACVLLYYGRANDAFLEISKACGDRNKPGPMLKQQEMEKEKQEKLQEHWCKKLGIADMASSLEGIESIKKEDLTEEFLKAFELGNADITTKRILLENVCPLIYKAGDKDVFLNGLINDFYLNCEAILAKKQTDIEKINKNIDRLNAFQEAYEACDGDYERVEPMVDVEGEADPVKVPRKRVKMCENIQKKIPYSKDKIKMPEKGWEKGFKFGPPFMKERKKKEDDDVAKEGVMTEAYYVDAKYERKTVIDPKTFRESCKICDKGADCPHAHTAIQLDLAPLSTKIRNLKGLVQMNGGQNLKKDKLIEPFRPAAKSFDVSKLPEPIKKKKKDDKKDEQEESKKRKGILERENPFRRPFDKE